MTDPGVLDIKTLRGPQQSAWQWLHWIVVNVPGEKAVPAAGQVLQPYGQPAPPAGNHRYTFILFEQKAEINPRSPKVVTHSTLEPLLLQMVSLLSAASISWRGPKQRSKLPG